MAGARMPGARVPRGARRALAAVALALGGSWLRCAPAGDGPPPASIRVFCQPGSLTNCFAVGFASANGHVTYWLQNLQGALSADATPFDIDAITVASRGSRGSGTADARARTTTLYRETLTGRGFPTICAVYGLVGAVERGGDCFDDVDRGASDVDLQVSYRKGGGAGFIGCTRPTGLGAGGTGTGFIGRTCLAERLDGWARFDASAFVVRLSGGLDTLRAATFDDLLVRIASCDVHVGARSGFAPTNDCSTDIAYARVAGRFAAVPAPASLALLGVGLAGLGAVGRARSSRSSGRTGGGRE